MLWLCLHFDELPRLALRIEDSQPAIVIERGKVLSLSESAQRAGIAVGDSPASARSRLPALYCAERDHGAEQAWLAAAACWAYQFGRPVVVQARQASVQVEIGASLKLFAGWTALRRRVAATPWPLEGRPAFAVAPSQSAAALLARAGAGLEHPVLKPAALAKALARLPLGLLPLADNALQILRASGMSRLSEFIDLPADALSRRLGLPALTYREQLLARSAEVWTSYEPPRVYRRRRELHAPVQDQQALLFVLRPLVEELCLYLRAREARVQHCEIRTRGDRGVVSRLKLRLSSPCREPERLLTVLRDHLERFKPDEPVLELQLIAEQMLFGCPEQQDLFASADGSERLLQAEERLLARLGPDRVRRVMVAPGHAPEQAWVIQRSGSTSTPDAISVPPRPLWLLSEPKPIEIQQLQGAPERIETAWWDLTPVRRDYYRAADKDGRPVWVFRRAGDARWFLHGYFD